MTSERQQQRAVEIRDAVIALRRGVYELSNYVKKRLIIEYRSEDQVPPMLASKPKTVKFDKSTNLPYGVSIKYIDDAKVAVEVFNVEWDDAGNLTVVTYTYGEWERELKPMTDTT